MFLRALLRLGGVVEGLCKVAVVVLQNPPARQVKQSSLPVFHTRRSRGPVFTARRPRLTCPPMLTPPRRKINAFCGWCSRDRNGRWVVDTWCRCRCLVRSRVAWCKCSGFQVLNVVNSDVGGGNGVRGWALRDESQEGVARARLSLTETARTTRSQHLSTTQDKTIQWDKISEALYERHTPQRLVQIHLYILMSNTLGTS